MLTQKDATGDDSATGPDEYGMDDEYDIFNLSSAEDSFQQP